MMTDNEIIKTSGEISCNKIKAIYPHITVSGDVGKPYYNIDWYDIEKQTMYRGYSSYKLSLVRKWLQENFEIVDNDIDNLINRQKAEIEALQMDKKQLESDIIIANNNYEHIKSIWESDHQKLSQVITKYKDQYKRLVIQEEDIKAKAIKEFVMRFKKKIKEVKFTLGQTWEIQSALKEVEKEMVGENK